MTQHSILVVEDNPISCKMSRLALESAGYAVTVAADAREALAAMAGAVPDLVLQDVGLPDMDGFELVRRLRGLPGGQDVPMLAVTGFLSRVEEGHAVAAGFTGFLTKPVEPSRLLQAVQRLLGEARGTDRPLEGRTALVVDDDASQLKLYSLRLRDAGCRVVTAADGLEALGAARRERPDVILSDVLMPRMDGFQLCQEVRHDAQLSGVPVVLHSAHFVEDEDLSLALSAGASAFLSRTAGMPELASALVDAIRDGPPALGAGAPRMPMGDYTRRVVRQLERQAERNALLVDRCASQGAALALLSGFSQALVQSGDVRASLSVLLSQGLDAAGLSRGGLYVRDGGRLELRAQVGFGPAGDRAADAFGCRAELEAVMDAGVPLVMGASATGEHARLLERMAARSALLLPFSYREEVTGLVFMLSADRDLAGAEWTAFGRVVALHLGQSLALADAYTRLASSERRHRELLDGASDAVFVLTADGIVTDANRRGLELLARPLEDVIGRRYDEFSPPGEARDGSRAAFARMAREGTVRALAAIARPSGELREMELSAARIETGDRRSVLAIATDVTDARRAERCRRVEHAMWRLLAAAPSIEPVLVPLLDELAAELGWDVALYWEPGPAPGAMSLEAISSRVRADAPSLARAALEGCGCGGGLAGPVLGTRLAAMEATADLVEGCPRCEAALRDGMSAALAFPVVADDEPVAVIELWRREPASRDQRLLDALTTIGRQLGQFIQRRRSEALLRESEARFRQLTESLPQVFWVKSPDRRRVLYVSPAYESVWGRTRRSFHDDPASWMAAVVPADRERVARSAGEQEGGPFEFRIARPGGAVRTVRAQLRNVLDERGSVTLRTGIAEDVTERRELEALYMQSQKMEAFGQLAGGVAHDFNNLLTVILGQGDILLSELREEDPMRAGLEPILKAAKRATSLTRQLLAFSRRQVLQPRTLDLNASVQDTAKMLRRLIGEDVELELKLASPPPLVSADPGQLEQVLLNLAVNARDAMPQGGTLAIETAESGSGERPVTLKVRDTGCGIAPEVQARIFEPFFTTKVAGKGTGLGLATVMGIVQQSGGSVEVRSEVGRGTEFTICLPRAAAGARPAGLEIIARAEPVPSRYGRTVLIVEDDLDLSNLAETILRRRGYQVLRARDAEHAVALARGHAERIDLLLTDVVMPGASGPQVAALVREARADVPVLYMTGYMDDAILNYGVQTGEVPLVQKPFTAAGLVRAVDQAIERASRGEVPR